MIALLAAVPASMESESFSDIMETVVRCYRLCVEHGNATAAVNLGTMYYNGTYVKRDYHQARRLYETAARAGEKRAICSLGYFYYYGRHQSPDYEKAYQYLNTGALLYDDPNCLYKLGDMYREGQYVEANQKFAVMLYFRALEGVSRFGAEDFCRPDILLRIGEAFLYGMEVEQDSKKALDCFLQALSGFYDRRKIDPSVSEMIELARDKIHEAEELLEEEADAEEYDEGNYDGEDYDEDDEDDEDDGEDEDEDDDTEDDD